MTEVVKLLLTCTNTDIDVPDDNGITALEYAIDRGYADIIKAFESRGAIQKTFFSAQYQAQNLAQAMFGVLRHVLTSTGFETGPQNCAI